MKWRNDRKICGAFKRINDLLLREMLLTHKDILLKLEEMEKHLSRHNKEIQYIFDVLKQLIQQPNEPRKKIGYKLSKDQDQ